VFNKQSLSVALLVQLVLVSTAKSVMAAEDTNRCTITTLSGVTYSNAVISRVEPDGITLVTEKGVSKVLFSDLSPSLRVEFNYDPQKTRQYEAEKARRAQIRATEEAEAAQRKARLDKIGASSIKISGEVQSISDGGMLLFLLLPRSYAVVRVARVPRGVGVNVDRRRP